MSTYQHKFFTRRVYSLLLILALPIILTACSEKQNRQKDKPAVTSGRQTKLTENRKVTLILDFLPNAVHTGIYRGINKDYYQSRNINLQVIKPTSTADTIKLIEAGKADFGMADAIDVAQQIDNGEPIQAVMAVTQRPLGGLITLKDSSIKTPKDLEGKRVGVTGVPSDQAVLDTIVQAAGGESKKVNTVTIGFNGVAQLENKKIDAFTGYWPADGAQIESDGQATRTFALDQYGGPAYPGLVIFTTKAVTTRDQKLLKAFTEATREGYIDTIKLPDQSLDSLLKENPTLKRGLSKTQLNNYLPLFKTTRLTDFGELRVAKLQELSKFLSANQLIKKPLTPSTYANKLFLVE